jgi:hypothetical protein
LPVALAEMQIAESGSENPLVEVGIASVDQPVAIPVPKPKIIASTQTSKGKAKRRKTK